MHWRFFENVPEPRVINIKFHIMSPCKSHVTNNVSPRSEATLNSTQSINRPCTVHVSGPGSTARILQVCTLFKTSVPTWKTHDECQYSYTEVEYTAE